VSNSIRSKRYRQTVFAPQNVPYIPPEGPTPTSKYNFYWADPAGNPAVGKLRDYTLDPSCRRHIVWATVAFRNRDTATQAQSAFSLRFWNADIEVARVPLQWFFCSTGGSFGPGAAFDMHRAARMTGGSWPAIEYVVTNAALDPGLTETIPAFEVPIHASKMELWLDALSLNLGTPIWIWGARILSFSA